MPKANGYGEERQNHPNRQVHREAFGPPTGERKFPGMPRQAGVWQQTEQYGWVPAKRSRMSKPNPGGYSPDEISNIMRNSGP